MKGKKIKRERNICDIKERQLYKCELHIWRSVGVLKESGVDIQHLKKLRRQSEIFEILEQIFDL